DPEDDRPKRSRATGAMPALARGDVAVGVVVGVLQLAPDLRVLPLVGSDGLDLGRGLALVDLLLVALEGRDEVADGLRPEEAGQEQDRRDPGTRPARGRGGGEGALPGLVGPESGGGERGYGGPP